MAVLPTFHILYMFNRVSQEHVKKCLWCAIYFCSGEAAKKLKEDKQYDRL